MEGESPDTKRVKEAVAALGEHFDTVMLFCTRHEQGERGGTVTWEHGTGQVRQWIIEKDEKLMSGVRKEDG